MQRHCATLKSAAGALGLCWFLIRLSACPLVLPGLSWPLLTPAPFAGPLLASAAHFPVPLPGLPLAQLCPALLELDEEPSGDKTLEPMTASDQGRPKTRWHSTRCFFCTMAAQRAKQGIRASTMMSMTPVSAKKMSSWRKCYTWDALPRTPDLKVGMFNPTAR